MSAPDWIERRKWATERYAWLLALINAGFSRSEAMQLLTVPSITVAGSSSPSVEELATKLTALLNRDLADPGGAP